MIPNPRVRVKVGKISLLDVSLWDLIQFHIFTSHFAIRQGGKLKVFLNNDEIERPIYEDNPLERR